jgi:hypothetical protein
MKDERAHICSRQLTTNKPPSPTIRWGQASTTPEPTSQRRHNALYCITGIVISTGSTGSYSHWYEIQALSYLILSYLFFTLTNSEADIIIFFFSFSFLSYLEKSTIQLPNPNKRRCGFYINGSRLSLESCTKPCLGQKTRGVSSPQQFSVVPPLRNMETALAHSQM